MTYIEASQFTDLLEEDASKLAYSAVVSIADALRGIRAGFHSWSAIKLYYSTFYTLRAYLCYNKLALFFSNQKPFKIEAVPGAYPQSLSTSSSHKAVMETFATAFQNSMILSQNIGLSDPLTWMVTQREFVNYRQAKFTEPDPLDLFKGLRQAKSLRRAVAEYIDHNDLSFDEDHAILAYPILALKELRLLRSGIFDVQDQERLLGLLSDDAGRIAAFEKIVGDA